eukprot:s5375_g2.t1
MRRWWSLLSHVLPGKRLVFRLEWPPGSRAKLDAVAQTSALPLRGTNEPPTASVCHAAIARPSAFKASAFVSSVVVLSSLANSSHKAEGPPSLVNARHCSSQKLQLAKAQEPSMPESQARRETPLVAPTVNVIVATSVTGMLLMTGPGETGPDPDGFFLDNWGSGWGSSRGMELALILDPSCTVIFHVLAQVCFPANEPAMKRPI